MANRGTERKSVSSGREKNVNREWKNCETKLGEKEKHKVG